MHMRAHTHNLFSCIKGTGSSFLPYYFHHNQPMNFICTVPLLLYLHLILEAISQQGLAHTGSRASMRACAHTQLVVFICVVIDWYVFVVEEKVMGEGTDGYEHGTLKRQGRGAAAG